jgi:hypothetical protein
LSPACRIDKNKNNNVPIFAEQYKEIFVLRILLTDRAYQSESRRAAKLLLPHLLQQDYFSTAFIFE